MEQRIVKIEPTETNFSITWRLGIRCNYDCMYCPADWHDNTSKHHSLNILKESWLSIYQKTKIQNLPYKISFTGGEVTNNKSFLPFIKWLKSDYSNNISKLLITTNGSATLLYYKKLFNYIDNMSFSIHSEHIDEKKLFNMIIELKKAIPSTKFLHVNIMNEFWNQDRIVYYQQLLVEHGISYNINEVDYNLQTRTHPIIKGKLNFEI